MVSHTCSGAWCTATSVIRRMVETSLFHQGNGDEKKANSRLSMVSNSQRGENQSIIIVCYEVTQGRVFSVTIRAYMWYITRF